jgi:hypothetical protein
MFPVASAGAVGPWTRTGLGETLVTGATLAAGLAAAVTGVAIQPVVVP